MNIIITKGKILKGDRIEVEYIKRDKDGSSAECTEKNKSAPPHPDLKTAFTNLSVHAALLGEFIPVEEIDDIAAPEHKTLEKINVSGFTIVGGEDMEGVILTAQKQLSSGKLLGFNTPLVPFYDEGPNAYKFGDDLLASIESTRQEMKNYLTGKHAESPQGELFGKEEKQTPGAEEHSDNSSSETNADTSTKKTRKRSSKEKVSHEEA